MVTIYLTPSGGLSRGCGMWLGKEGNSAGMKRSPGEGGITRAGIALNGQSNGCAVTWAYSTELRVRTFVPSILDFDDCTSAERCRGRSETADNRPVCAC
jgi:hypothetical protein